jgi:hypothetical protein
MQSVSLVATLAIRARTVEQVKAFRDKQRAIRRPMVLTDRYRAPAEPLGDPSQTPGPDAA